MRILISTLFAVVAVGLDDRSAGAQGPGRPAGPVARTPTYSPYLNLLRQGNSAGVNYYGLVRPEVENRNSLRSLQGQIVDNRRAIAEQSTTAGSALPGTGDKTVTFLNTGGYFMNLIPQGGSGSGTGNVVNRTSGRFRETTPSRFRR